MSEEFTLNYHAATIQHLGIGYTNNCHKQLLNSSLILGMLTVIMSKSI